jgi:hypothetical protein
MQPMLMVWSTVNRLSSSAEVVGEAQRIDPMRALPAVTREAAWQLFQQGNHSSLELGIGLTWLWCHRIPCGIGFGIRDIKVLENVVGRR